MMLWKAKGTNNNPISYSEFCDKAQAIALLLVALVWDFFFFFPGWKAVETHLETRFFPG